MQGNQNEPVRAGPVFECACLLVLGLVLGAPTVAARAGETPSDPIARLDALWAERRWPDAMDESIAVGTQTRAADSRSYEVTWRLARASWWAGHTANDNQMKRSACSTAMEYAEAAIELQPGRVEGHHFYAMAIGDYGTAVGISRAVWKGVGKKFEEAELQAYVLDKHFDDGAPMTALGRFYSVLPWPLQDLDKSQRYLEELREAHPRALIGRFYLAETYYMRGERALAQAELEFLVQAEPLTGPLSVPEPAASLAAQRLTQWFPDAQPPRIAGRDAPETVARDPR